MSSCRSPQTLRWHAHTLARPSVSPSSSANCWASHATSDSICWCRRCDGRGRDVASAHAAGLGARVCTVACTQGRRQGQDTHVRHVTLMFGMCSLPAQGYTVCHVWCSHRYALPYLHPIASCVHLAQLHAQLLMPISKADVWSDDVCGIRVRMAELRNTGAQLLLYMLSIT